MRAILAAGDYPAIVLEDDARLRPGWARIVPPDDWEIALLGAVPREPRFLPAVRDGWARVGEEPWKHSHAFAVRNASAARALERAFRREQAGPCDFVWGEAFRRHVTYAAVPQRTRQGYSESDLR
jgi:hypothetical protein